jgi:hypothetical protein
MRNCFALSGKLGCGCFGGNSNFKKTPKRFQVWDIRLIKIKIKL